MTAPVNYSTSVDSLRTVGEIQSMLGKHGAEAVAILYDSGGITGITFRLRGSDFRLPFDVDAMQRLLVREDKAGRIKSGVKPVRTSRPQAERVVARVIKDWLAAQLTLVAAGMVPLDEIMLPYLIVGPDMLLRDQWRDRAALTVGEPQ